MDPLDALPRDWQASASEGAAAEGLLLNTVGGIILVVLIVLDAPAAQCVKAGSEDHEEDDKSQKAWGDIAFAPYGSCLGGARLPSALPVWRYGVLMSAVALGGTSGTGA